MSRRITLLFSILLLLGACGGSKPIIQHRLDMEVLAPTPPEARASVAEAYRDQYRAELELAHTQFLLDDVEYELKIARAEREQVKHSQKIARLEERRNEAMFKTSLAEAASTLLNDMKKQDLAHKHQIRYLKAQRSYLRKRLAHAKVAVTHAVARFELAKAQLAKERDTIPKGFKLTRFVAQEKRARAIADKKARRAKAAQTKARAKEKRWKKAKK